MLYKKSHRKFLFYTIFLLFIIWFIAEPAASISGKDICFLVLMLLLLQALIEKKHLYAKLSIKYKNQSELLNNLFLNCPDLVYRKDSNLRYKDCNPVMRAMLNLDTQESIFNKTDYDFYPKETAKIIRNYDRQVLQSGRIVSYKIEKNQPNGENKIYETLLAPVTDKKHITGVIGILRDTTQFEALKEKMFIQNAQLESILNNMPYIIYMKDCDGKLIFANKNLEKEIGIAQNKLLGVNFCQKYFKDEFSESQEEDRKVINTKASIVLEKQLKFSDKMKGWYQITKSPIFDHKNNVVGIIVMIKNFDSEKALEARKINLVSTITHDLKTPTNAQLGAMNILLDGSLGELNKDQKEMVELSKNSNIYMKNMISTILSAYKSEDENDAITPVIFNFYELVHSTAKEITNLAITKQQNIVIFSRLFNEEIQADKLQIKRAVMNLLGNAITYGFEKTDIIITINELDNDVIFNVINKGYHISDEKLKEIFEKYKTNENAKFNKASTGLGLYLSKKIIKSHNGDIYARSDTNNTCTFGFKIPRICQTENKAEKIVN